MAISETPNIGYDRIDLDGEFFDNILPLMRTAEYSIALQAHDIIFANYRDCNSWKVASNKLRGLPEVKNEIIKAWIEKCLVLCDANAEVLTKLSWG